MAFGKRKKVIAIAVIAIMVLAGSAFILSSQKPEQSLAEKMTLRPSDLNMPGWAGNAAPDWGLTANERSQYEMYMANDTFHLDVGVQVYNSTLDCHAAFLEIMSGVNAHTQGLINLSLGDEAVYGMENYYARHYVVFVRANVIAWLNTQPFYPYIGQEWHYNATINLAMLQLEKIDRYLAG